MAASKLTLYVIKLYLNEKEEERSSMQERPKQEHAQLDDAAQGVDDSNLIEDKQDDGVEILGTEGLTNDEVNDTLLTVPKFEKMDDDLSEKFDEDFDYLQESSRLSRFTAERGTSALVGALTNELATSDWKFQGSLVYI